MLLPTRMQHQARAKTVLLVCGDTATGRLLFKHLYFNVWVVLRDWMEFQCLFFSILVRPVLGVQTTQTTAASRLRSRELGMDRIRAATTLMKSCLHSRRLGDCQGYSPILITVHGNARNNRVVRSKQSPDHPPDGSSWRTTLSKLSASSDYDSSGPFVVGNWTRQSMASKLPLGPTGSRRRSIPGYWTISRWCIQTKTAIVHRHMLGNHGRYTTFLQPSWS